ncbi:unnamed protein product [marine sediment metagenome]|uniref:Uncharacterized protein n=1 Tax=marine sediment metagenome TaxID=412755 RepID=X1TX46_9ZZZZ
MASPERLGVNLALISLIKLLSVFGDSNDLERDFRQLVGDLFKNTI